MYWVIWGHLPDTQRVHERYGVVVLASPSMTRRMVSRASSKATAIARFVVPIAGVRYPWPAAEKTPGIFLENGGMITDALAS